MGLNARHVEMLIREARHRPVAGTVVFIGRQSVYVTPTLALAMLRENGIETTASVDEIEIDRSTLNRAAQFRRDDLITDRALMRLLGAREVMALDHDDYEGAEITHDLNIPFPESLHGIADFVIDGSTLDNVFNPATALQNLSAMLKPGGRLLSANAVQLAASGDPYVMMSPSWYLDYFTLNGFADCKVYITISPKGYANVFTPDLAALLDASRAVSPFSSPYPTGCVVMAEKGDASTFDLCPTQRHYRSKAQARLFRENLTAIASSSRPHIARSAGEIAVAEVTGGYLFVGSDFIARNPAGAVPM